MGGQESAESKPKANEQEQQYNIKIAVSSVILHNSIVICAFLCGVCIFVLKQIALEVLDAHLCRYWLEKVQYCDVLVLNVQPVQQLRQYNMHLVLR